MRRARLRSLLVVVVYARSKMTTSKKDEEDCFFFSFQREKFKLGKRVMCWGAHIHQQDSWGGGEADMLVL